MEEAVISYRLGRDSLEDESGIKKYRLVFCACGRIKWVDKFVAASVFFIEAAITGIASPGILLLRNVQLLGICILKCTYRHFRQCPTFGWLPRHRSLEFNLKEKIQAYRILCEYCLSEKTGEHYESSGSSLKGPGEGHNLTDDKIHEEICKIFRGHRRNIRLSLLLDNIGPSRLSYLLQELTFVLMSESIYK